MKRLVSTVRFCPSAPFFADLEILLRRKVAVKWHVCGILSSFRRFPYLPSLGRSKDQAGEWRNGTSFGLNDLEALVTVAHQAREWIAAHALTR